MEATKELQIEFIEHFRNVSLILDCVTCEKCKLWGKLSHRRDCHFDDTPCLSLLKHLLEVQGGAIK